MGLGYSGAVAWALRAIYVNSANVVTTPEIRSVALAGACVVGGGMGVAVVMRGLKYSGVNVPFYTAASSGMLTAEKF